MDLSVIIVSWKVRERLLKNLEALYKSQGNFSWEVFVVDNDSGDGTVEAVQARFPEVKVIANDQNLGFAKANNQAIKQAQGDFILLLNPDMLVQTDSLEKMLGFMKSQPSAVVASARLYDESGKILKHVRKFPIWRDQALIILKLPHLFPACLNKYLQSDFDYNQAAAVDSVRGSFFMISRLAYKKISGQERPLLDERYFIWFEEVDFCRQVKKLGGEVWYTPLVSAIDGVGQSFKRVKTGQTQKYFRASMLSYFKKWEPRWQACFLSVLWPIGIGLARGFKFLKK